MNRPFRTRPRQTEPETCDTIDLLLSLYADGMASEQETRRVETHLPNCASCRQSLLWMQATRKALAMRPVQLPPADLRARIASAIATPAQVRPTRVFTLRPAYAAAASLVLAGGVVGYGLLRPHSQSAQVTPITPKKIQVAQTPPVPVLSLPVKSMAPLPVAPHHPRKLVSAPSWVTAERPDTANENNAADTTPSRPIASAESPVSVKALAPAPVYQITPAPPPHRAPAKKPVLRTPSPRLMADRTLPIIVIAPKPNTPVSDHADHTEKVANLPTTPPDVPVSPPVTAPPPRVQEEAPTPSIREASLPRRSEGSFHSVDLLSSAKEYAHTHQASLEHDLSLAGQRAVRTAVHTTAFTSNLDGQQSGNLDLVHTP